MLLLNGNNKYVEIEEKNIIKIILSYELNAYEEKTFAKKQGSYNV